jgi:probable phosphoglycerate mutase
MSFGAWQGKTYDEVDAAQPGVVAQREAELWSFRPPAGESYADLATRVTPWVSSLPDWAKLIVVCHGAIGRAVRGRYCDLAPEKIITLSHRQDEFYRLHDRGFEILRTGFKGRGDSDAL